MYENLGGTWPSPAPSADAHGLYLLVFLDLFSFDKTQAYLNIKISSI